MKRVLWFLSIGVCFAGLIYFLSDQAGAPSASAAANGPKPKISWSPCYQDYGPFECGTVQVPLDYGDPGVAAVSIALVRLPATDPARKIGTLFFNPGGPGGSGIDFVLALGPYLYSDEVRARFDIVGFDPRGIARSTALRCFGNLKKAPSYPFAFPTTPGEEAFWYSSDPAVAGACDQRGSKLYDHMSTADAARDLDLLRRAVGDDKLTYIGYSYGTFLGMTYVNLFPQKVRAVVLDSNIDPIAWTVGEGSQSDTLPFSTRLKSAAGAMATLREFFRLCDEGDSPFKGEGPGDTETIFAAMAARLKAQPLVITTPTGFTYEFTYADLIGTCWGAMYDSYSWPDLAYFLAGLEAAMSPLELGARLSKLWESQGFITKRGFPHYYIYYEGFPAVACADSDNPADYAAWSAAAAAAEAEDGYFGPAWTWASSICQPWGGDKGDRYVGPWDNVTSNPVLIVNNLYDPATRYESAMFVETLLPNSRLLTINGWGHCTFWLSALGDQTVSDYLLFGTLPDQGTVYDQDWVPFQAPSAGAFDIGTAMEARARLTRMIVPDAVRNLVKGEKED